MNFKDVRSFLESWGLHFDSKDGDSTNIPYPQVYERMRRDVINIPSIKTDEDIVLVKRFISSITDTTDGETYLVSDNWDQIKNMWKQHIKGSSNGS